MDVEGERADEKERVRRLLATQALVRTALQDVRARHPHRDKVVDYLDMIILGNRISTTLHAPRHWRPGALLLSGYPPAPQADHMRKGKLGNAKLNLTTPQHSGDLLNQIQEEIQLTAKAALLKKTPSLGPPSALPATTAPLLENKRMKSEPPPPPDGPAKRQRTININFGFESDSDD
jgi:hypothetical protein